MIKSTRFALILLFVLSWLPVWAASRAHKPSVGSQPVSIHGGNLTVEAFGDGSYALQSTAIPGDVLRSGMEVETSAGTLKSSLYPRHSSAISAFHDELGSGKRLTVTHSGLPGAPDLICEFRIYDNQPWGDLRITVKNSTAAAIEIRALRVVKSNADAVINLGGPASEDRVLSEDFSENPVQLADLGEPKDGVHQGFGDQLIYNRKSGESLFLAALSQDRLLTGFHLVSTTGPGAHVHSYDVSDTGTDAAIGDQSKEYSSGHPDPFRVQVPAGASVSSEPLMFAIGSDYHQQLENFGHAIRILHKALVITPTPIGWWSWTAYYYGVTENTVLTNAAWLKQNLEPFGYNYFFIDEGYSYARGEYATPDANAFPDGMAYTGHRVEDLGLKFGVWVAPFEVSERSWVYQHHPEWLVHNLAGELIHTGKVSAKTDDMYALDTTHPGAQEYLRYTYRTLAKEWGVHFIKMDFMDSSAQEGVHYRPNTTALEALRTGLEIIRSTVGDDVVLDKDGGFMLTPVGLVNTGRIGQDTGHTFGSTHDAATGVIARYYMNRNFYLSDPDAFTVSKQVIGDRIWHGNKVPLTLDEAETSIALSAVSGGMFEIGDDLPALGASPDRMVLVKNPDLLDMARLSRSSVPLDLMTYRPEDKQPSVLLLKETQRQQILTVFNWTLEPRSHTLKLNELGLNANGSHTATDVLRGGAVPIENGALSFTLPPHSARMIKLIDTSTPEIAPSVEAHGPSVAKAGELAEFHAVAGSADAPVLNYHWEFGDGVSADGADVSHTYTQAGKYTVRVSVTGLNGRTAQKPFELVISVTGAVPTGYNPAAMKRYSEAK
ncbi:MAG: PKD domain-containing protein [Terracidiphilus sp.]